MQLVPWRLIADWRCVACGDCCRLFSVVISFHEWLRIVRDFGVEHTASGVNKLFIRRKNDGSCAFLQEGSGACVCSLQQRYMKPKACQLWPFQVLTKPRFGYAKDALYNYGSNELFIYADPMCNGLRYGSPSLEFKGSTLKEFVEIAVGLRSSQLKTTSSYVFPQYGRLATVNRRKRF